MKNPGVIGAAFGFAAGVVGGVLGASLLGGGDGTLGQGYGDSPGAGRSPGEEASQATTAIDSETEAQLARLTKEFAALRASIASLRQNTGAASGVNQSAPPVSAQATHVDVVPPGAPAQAISARVTALGVASIPAGGFAGDLFAGQPPSAWYERIALLERFLSEYPKDEMAPDHLVTLAWLYAHERRYDRALEVLDQYGAATGLGEATKLQVRAGVFRQVDPDKYLQTMEELWNVPGAKADVRARCHSRYVAAVRFVELGRYERARELLRTLVDDVERAEDVRGWDRAVVVVSAWNYRVETFIKAGDYSAAEREMGAIRERYRTRTDEFGARVREQWPGWEQRLRSSMRR